MEPIPPAKRIESLDILRGIALLGILIINIQSFSMPSAAYGNPSVFGDFTGVNRWVWIISHFLAEQKFITIFAILFGAGVLLMSAKIEKEGGKPVWIHVRRMLWLIVLGVGHAYLLWYGDILVCYGICGLMIFWLRKWPPVWLLITGLVFYLIPAITSIYSGLTLPSLPVAEMQQLELAWNPNPFFLKTEIAVYQSDWGKQMLLRIPAAYLLQTKFFLYHYFWLTFGLMLTGMAFFKYGFLTLQRSTKFYWKLAVMGLVPGSLLVICGIVTNFKAGWSLEYSKFIGSQFNYVGGFLVALGYISVIMLLCRSNRFVKAARPLAALGRTALSNYLLQTVLCTLIFYGHGFGLFGQMSRLQQALTIVAIWIFQMAITSWWLRFFRFGPCEWVWRTLTYWKFQPLRKRNPK